MTNREFFIAVASANISEDITAKANELIEALNARNDKRKSADSKEKQATAERQRKVLDFLRENPTQIFTRDEISAATGLTDGQVTSACSALINNTLVTKGEVKVDKAKKVCYSLAKAE